MTEKPVSTEYQPHLQFMSASSWTTPYVLMSIWGLAQLWLQGGPVQTLSQDLIMGLIYSTLIAGSMLVTVNRSIGHRLATGNTQVIIEETLGCLLAVLLLTAVLAFALLTKSDVFRDPLHLATQLAGVALMANCWILSTVLLSSAKYKALLNSFALGGLVLATTLILQPHAGLSYHALAWLSAIAITVLMQAIALTRYLPQPSRIDLSLVCGHPNSAELPLAGVSFGLSLWLSRPSAHTQLLFTDNMQLLEDSLSIAYLILLPVSMLAWTPLEKRFKEALFAFEQAANGGGTLSTLDYQKNNLIFQSLSGMQRVHIALIAAVAVALAFDQISAKPWSDISGPNWLLPLSLLHVALQMVSLCAMRLLCYLHRDRELLIIALLQLLLISVSVKIGYVEENTLAYTYSLVLSSISVCLLSVWFLRHRLERFDYLFFMGDRQTTRQ